MADAQGTPAATGGFIWYELITPDPDAASAFYAAVTDWTVSGPAAEPAPGGVDYRHIARADGGSQGGVLRLTDDMAQHGARPCWIGYLHVAHCDAAVAAIAADGGQVLMPKMTIPEGSFALVTDPQGVPTYVMAPTPPAGTPDAQNPGSKSPGSKNNVYDRWAVGHVSWNELYSPDLEAAKTFYTKHFNFEFNDSLPMGDMGDYCFIDHDGETIGAMMQKPPFVPAGCWNHYIRVADIDEAKMAIEAHGGQVLNGPMDVPGGDRIINAMDPQGAPFSLVAGGTAPEKAGGTAPEKD